MSLIYKIVMPSMHTHVTHDTSRGPTQERRSKKPVHLGRSTSSHPARHTTHAPTPRSHDTAQPVGPALPPGDPEPLPHAFQVPSMPATNHYGTGSIDVVVVLLLLAGCNPTNPHDHGKRAEGAASAAQTDCSCSERDTLEAEPRERVLELLRSMLMPSKLDLRMLADGLRKLLLLPARARSSSVRSMRSKA